MSVLTIAGILQQQQPPAGGGGLGINNVGVRSTFTTASVTPALPTHNENDVLLYIAYMSDNRTVTTPPSGYTMLHEQAAGAGNDRGMYVYYKVAGASETAQQITFSGAPQTGEGHAQVYQVEGVATTGTIVGSDVDTGSNDETPSTATGASVIGQATAGNLIIHAVVMTEGIILVGTGMTFPASVTDETVDFTTGTVRGINYAIGWYETADTYPSAETWTANGYAVGDGNAESITLTIIMAEA